MTSTDEPNDGLRDKAIGVALYQAERSLGLHYDGDLPPTIYRAQQILAAAMQRSLDPRLYQVAWFVRRMCQTKH
jgi:hypothetical protein